MKGEYIYTNLFGFVHCLIRLNPQRNTEEAESRDSLAVDLFVFFT